MSKRFLNLKEISALLRITERTARNRLSSGLPMPPSLKIGRTRLFDEDDVLKWLEENKQGRQTP
jgi:predicted DNA-binding transcriptional regulator AlpA